MGKPTRGKFKKREKPEFEQYILDLARVTRVTRGGKQLSFRACVVLGDMRSRVGFGVAKGKDVQIAVDKAVSQAKKNMIGVSMINQTIPHPITHKFKAATVFLKPAPKGSGIIAGGPVRTMLELAGVLNVSAKIMGKTKNKISIVKAVFEALQNFKIEGKELDKVPEPPKEKPFVKRENFKRRPFDRNKMQNKAKKAEPVVAKTETPIEKKVVENKKTEEVKTK